MKWNERLVEMIVAALLVAVFGATNAGYSAEKEIGVLVVTDRSPGLAATHGAEKLMAALKARGVEAEKVESPDAAKGRMLIIAGLASGSGAAAQLLEESDTKAPDGPEALVIRTLQWKGKPAVLVCGTDDRGLMYAEWTWRTGSGGRVTRPTP